MKGLFIKDLCLLKQQKNSMLIMLLISIFLAVTGNETSFVMSYMSLLAATLAIGTITYDDFGNGMPFLFTLPTSRIDYIKSKYVFSTGFTFIVWILASVITCIVNEVTHKSIDVVTHLAVCGVVLGIVFITLSVMIPIHLKFGAEKSKIVMVTMMGGIALIVFVGVKLGNEFGLGKDQIISFINSINMWAFIAIFVLCIILFLMISYRISIKVIMKKEY